ncbi:MAG: hypothetical protein GY827_01370 [Cytophagales bacterium]|nr:hypothetical protein [Cytophagales bacterium]
MTPLLVISTFGWIIKIIAVVLLLGLAYKPFREAGRYRFQGQTKLLLEALFYVGCAVLVFALSNWFVFFVALAGLAFYFYKNKS